MRLLLIVLFGLLLQGALTAVEPAAPVELPADAQAALSRFVAAGAQLQRDGDARKTAVRTKLVQALEQVQTTESKAGRLDSALAVKTLKDNLAADQVPDLAKAITAPGLPKGVTRPTESYQTDMLKLDKDLAQRFAALKDQAVKELDVVKVAETKAGRLDAALAVKEQQEQLKSGTPGATRKAPLKTLVFGKGATITPVDAELLRRGCSTSTIEFVVLSVAKDGMLFETGGQANGQSLALMDNALWYAIANLRNAFLIKVPLGSAKPPLHLAVGYDKGAVQIWINGVLAKQDANAPVTISDNGGGGFGVPEGGPNEPSMPRQGFEGEIAAFRFVDKLVYTAPFTPSYPLPATDSIRIGVDAAALEPGPLTEIKGAQRLAVTGEMLVKAP